MYGKEFLMVNMIDTVNTAWVLLFEHVIIGLGNIIYVLIGQNINNCIRKA